MKADILEGLITMVILMLPVMLAGIMYFLSEHVGFLRDFIDWLLDMTKLNDD